VTPQLTAAFPVSSAAISEDSLKQGKAGTNSEKQGNREVAESCFEVGRAGQSAAIPTRAKIPVMANKQPNMAN